jgi:hypothetical protein
VTGPRQRSWLEIRWRQFRNPPPPVLRAVVADLAVAAVGGILLLAYDVAIARGVPLPGGDLRTLAGAAFVVTVLVAGSMLTYLLVELPSGSRAIRRRSGWSALLGLFAALPVAYLTLVIVFQILRPMLG